MISFSICLVILVLAYFIYGKVVEKIFGPDDRPTPAIYKNDGVDYVVLPSWKIFMIQFLNIAGLGPIFGAVLGAMYGTTSYLWIVLGGIFIGGVHDYMSGMLSLRNGGENLTDIYRKYLGKGCGIVSESLVILILILVPIVFVAGAAGLLDKLTPDFSDYIFWICVIFGYFMIATFFPVDKIIGKIYPLFALTLLFMAVGVMVMMYITQPHIPELWDGLQNTHPDAANTPLFPFLFISIACGAVSGFHASQSPLMARCVKSERHGRPIFYGAMIVESIVALIWAAAANYFFHVNGMDESNASIIVNNIVGDLLGPVGMVIALLGIVAAPISTGDTSMRAVRLIFADKFKLDQKKYKNRLIICVPLFAMSIAILIYMMSDPNGFNKLWRYFAFVNQTIAVFTLWALSIFLRRNRKGMWYLITFVPALMMTAVCSSYLLVAPECFGLSTSILPYTATVTVIASIAGFALIKNNEA